MMFSIFSGVRSGQADEVAFSGIYNKGVVLRLIPFIAPYKKTTVVAIISMLIYTLTLIAIPWIIKLAIDDFIGNSDLSGLAWIVALFIFTAILNGISNYVQQTSIAKVGQGVLYDLRRAMFSHLQKLSLSYFDKTEIGRIMSRVQGDVWQLQEFMSVVIMTLADILSLLGIVIALLIMNLKLGLISMSVIPVLGLVMILWQPYALKSFMRVRIAISIVNAALNENITGVRVVQSMNRENRNIALFDEKNTEHLKANIWASQLSSGLLPPVDILTAVAIGLALYFGSGMVRADGLEIGVLIAFVMYIQRFFDPIRNLTMQYTQLQRSMASGSRIFELLDTKAELTDLPNAQDLPKIKGEVELRNVNFSYDTGKQYDSNDNRIADYDGSIGTNNEFEVLKNVNLHIKAGETIAIVGPTGAGKTTLVSLIARFYDVPRDKGGIFVDGYDIRDVTRSSLVGQTSMVLQDPFLFSGTVRDNIKYHNTDTSDQKMVESAKAVGAHDFIMALDHGYDTILEERGSNVSLGQRQLISFARAIVADPHILILDEATANIDSYTELLIQRALGALLKDRTAIVIAHRLSTIRGSDKIIVMNQGTIEEIGTHKQLIRSNGLYANLNKINYTSIEQQSAS